MTESFSDKQWRIFESTGRIADYLAYRGIGVKSISDLKGEKTDASHDRGNSDLGKGAGG